MNTLVLLFFAVACAIIGLSLIGFGIYLLRSRSRQAQLISMNKQHTPKAYTQPKIGTLITPQKPDRTVPSDPAPSVDETDGQQRPDGFFMPLPAQLDSENEHSETTMIRNVLQAPDSETTLRPTAQPSPFSQRPEHTLPPNSSLQKQDGLLPQNLSALPEITENKTLPQGLFPSAQQDKESDEEAEDDPTTIFNSKS